MEACSFFIDTRTLDVIPSLSGVESKGDGPMLRSRRAGLGPRMSYLGYLSPSIIQMLRMC